MNSQDTSINEELNDNIIKEDEKYAIENINITKVYSTKDYLEMLEKNKSYSPKNLTDTDFEFSSFDVFVNKNSISNKYAIKRFTYEDDTEYRIYNPKFALNNIEIGNFNRKYRSIEVFGQEYILMKILTVEFEEGEITIHTIGKIKKSFIKTKIKYSSSLPFLISYFIYIEIMKLPIEIHDNAISVFKNKTQEKELNRIIFVYINSSIIYDMSYYFKKLKENKEEMRKNISKYLIMAKGRKNRMLMAVSEAKYLSNKRKINS